MVIIKLIFCILLFELYNFLSLLLGYLIFYIGKKVRVFFIEKLGHSLVAYFSAPLFRLNSRWISRNCPEKHCDKCVFWTCKDFYLNKK